MNSFFIFYLYSSSIGFPIKDKTLNFGFYAILRATLLHILVCSDQNISKSFNLLTTSNPAKSVAKVSDMNKDFKFGMPCMSFMIPLSVILFPLISTDNKKGILLAMMLHVRQDILLFLI